MAIEQAEVVRQASELFAKSIVTSAMPAEMSPLIVHESAKPGHFPVVFEMLKMFGTSQRTTYSTELDGRHLPKEKKAWVPARYLDILKWARGAGGGPMGLKKEYPLNASNMKYFDENDQRYSSRLHILVASHTKKWTEDNMKVMWLMANVFGPSLKYQYDVRNMDQPGDFHLVVDWMFKNLEELDQLYIRKEDLSHVSARIASGQGIALNYRAMEGLLAGWSGSLGKINLKDVTPDKAKWADMTKSNEFTRTGRSIITNRFEQLFVDLNPSDNGSIRRVMGESADNLDNDECEFFGRRMNNLQLLLLSLLVDSNGRARPMNQLDKLTGMGGKLLDVLARYQELAARSFDEDPSRELNAVDSDMPGNALSSALLKLRTSLSKSPYPGFGAGRAILDRLTELKMKNDPQAEKLETVMYHLVRIAEGKTQKDFNLTLEEE